MAAALLTLAAAVAAAWKLMVHVIGLLPGGVEVAAQTDGDGAAGAAGPNVLMNWDLQVEPPGSDEAAPAPSKMTEEPPP
ncbi:MAG TPA: hypothetical protein VGN89_02785 [Phenylobacterium sp.]|nr:hypothetical protein [Phenylobacterium sp.]